MRTIAITNQKGGCGKTTTAVNLAAALAMKGHRTLIVDLDPQGHATLAFGLIPENMEKTIYDVLTNPGFMLSEILQPTDIDKLMEEFRKVHQFNVFCVNSVAQATLADYILDVDLEELGRFYQAKRDLFL